MDMSRQLDTAEYVAIGPKTSSERIDNRPALTASFVVTYPMRLISNTVYSVQRQILLPRTTKSVLEPRHLAVSIAVLEPQSSGSVMTTMCTAALTVDTATYTLFKSGRSLLFKSSNSIASAGCDPVCDCINLKVMEDTNAIVSAPSPNGSNLSASSQLESGYASEAIMLMPNAGRIDFVAAGLTGRAVVRCAIRCVFFTVVMK